MSFVSIYKIPSRGSCCALNGEIFKPEEELVSNLAFGEDGEYQRHDYCLKCWEKQKTIKKSHFIWKTRVPQKKVIPPPTPDEKALTLLKSYLGKTGEEETDNAYLLVLYLERRCQLVARKELWKRKDPLHYYEHLDTGEIFGVYPRQPTLLTMVTLQKILDEVV